MHSAILLLLFGACNLVHTYGSPEVSSNSSRASHSKGLLNLRATGYDAPPSSFTTPSSFSIVATTPNSTPVQVPGLTTPSNTEGIKECDPVPYGHGPRPTDDTMLAFLQNPDFSIMALNSPAPDGYTSVYTNEHASSVSAKYLRYDEVNDYSASNCSRQCDRTTGCQAFNIYFERTPTLNLGSECKTSLSSTMIKCVLWGDSLQKSDATNRGYLRWDFGVVIAGSNAYNKGEKAAVKSMVSPTVVTDLVVVLSLVVFAFALC
jgi:hypothetical protein